MTGGRRVVLCVGLGVGFRVGFGVVRGRLVGLKPAQIHLHVRWVLPCYCLFTILESLKPENVFVFNIKNTGPKYWWFLNILIRREITNLS